MQIGHETDPESRERIGEPLDVEHRARHFDVVTLVQEAVRGFGQAPTNYAIETAIDKVAAATGLERIEVRRRNFIRKEEFPYLIPSGSTTRKKVSNWACSRPSAWMRPL